MFTVSAVRLSNYRQCANRTDPFSGWTIIWPALDFYCLFDHGRPHIGANGVSWPPWKSEWNSKERKHAKKSSFLCLWYILRAIRAGICKDRRYADHIFIQIYFKMHHFVVKLSTFSSPQAARGHWPSNQNTADVPVFDVSSICVSRFIGTCLLLLGDVQFSSLTC